MTKLEKALNGDFQAQVNVMDAFTVNSPLKLFVAAALNFMDARDTLLEAVSTGYFNWNEDAAMKEFLLKFENKDLASTFLAHIVPTLNSKYLATLFHALSGSVFDMGFAAAGMHADTYENELFFWADQEFAINEITKFFKEHGFSATLLQDFLRFVPDGV